MSTTSQTTAELPLPLADFWLSIDRNGLYNPLVATEVGKRLIVATMEGTRPTIWHLVKADWIPQFVADEGFPGPAQFALGTADGSGFVGLEQIPESARAAGGPFVPDYARLVETKEEAWTFRPVRAVDTDGRGGWKLVGRNLYPDHNSVLSVTHFTPGEIGPVGQVEIITEGIVTLKPREHVVDVWQMHLTLIAPAAEN